jgi:hypothetical protein
MTPTVLIAWRRDDFGEIALIREIDACSSFEFWRRPYSAILENDITNSFGVQYSGSHDNDITNRLITLMYDALDGITLNDNDCNNLLPAQSITKTVKSLSQILCIFLKTRCLPVLQ